MCSPLVKKEKAGGVGPAPSFFLSLISETVFKGLGPFSEVSWTAS